MSILNCPTCLSINSVQNDDNYGEEQLVCTSCGTVIESSLQTIQSTNFTPASNSDRILNVKKLPRGIQHLAGSKTTSFGLKTGLQMIKMLSSNYHIPEHIAEDTQKLFETAFKCEAVHDKPIEFKEKLAALCVYSKLRQNGWPISINTICYSINCNKDDISAPMKILTKHLNITFQSPAIEDLVETFFSSLHSENESEKLDLMKKTITVLELCKDCWLTSGRSQRACVFGAAFLAWKSNLLDRSKVKVSTFCSLFKIVICPSLNKFSQQLSKTLVKLANELPWVNEGEIKCNNVSEHLDDILKYSLCLRTAVITKYKDTKSEPTNLGKEELAFEVFREPPAKRLKSEPFNPNISTDIDDKEIDGYICSKSEIEFKRNLIVNF